METQATAVEPESIRFIKVQDFFNESEREPWQWLKGATNITFDSRQKRVDVGFVNADGNPCTLLLYFLSDTIIRKRFHPGRAAADYPVGNKRAVVMNSVEDLIASFETFGVEFNRTDTGATIRTSAGGKYRLWVEIQQNPFGIRISRYDSAGQTYPVLRDWDSPIRYRRRIIHGLNEEEYSVIQSFAKPPLAKYIGFGEKGGASLVKNVTQMCYFNYDNMRYKQIYNVGPLYDAEPLYHTSPFFMEFGGSPLNANSCYGVFIDNASETFVDVGYTDTRRYEFGAYYGELDFYMYFGDNSIEVMEGHADVVGHSRLKPRYCLGYHQGCYGYDSREKVIQAALKHRQNQIPLDGIHIDVDVQYNYQTFTVNDERYGAGAPFSDPAGMFGYLGTLGVKCSTNITPIVSNRGEWSPVPYKAYSVAKKNDLLIKESRSLGEIGEYQNYGDGYEWWRWGNLGDVRTGEPFVGEVYYGGGRGTTGSYYDLGKAEARLLWGEQYRCLFDIGLEMVWQDMTTPAIRDTRGDMKSFPFALQVTDDFRRKYDGESEAVKAAQGADEISPAITIRNLYAYNLHKATYHGLNNLGTLSPFSIISVDENRISRSDAGQILNQLKEGGYLIDVSSGGRDLYKVAAEKDLNGNVSLPLSVEYNQFNDGILNVLRLCQRLDAKRGNRRNFILGRGGFTGMHRFAALWTGDNCSSWDFLKMNVSQVLALGISGQPLSGQDVGGFEQEAGNGGKWIDPELLIRWTQVGAFLPWFRNHYMAKGVKDFQEVYAFQDVIDQIPQDYRYMYEAVLPVCRHYIGLRYRLMQLFYDAMFESVQTGLPIARPLFLTANADGALFNDKKECLDTQFLVRNDVMVAPILFKQSGDTCVRDIYMPAGSDWFCYMDNRQPLSGKIGGGMTFRDFDARITTNPAHIPFTAPIFIRSGAVIPTMELEQFVGEYRSRGQLNPITLNIYPGREGEYTMYLDDGISRSSAPAGRVDEGHDPLAKGEYRSVRITHRYNQRGQREIKITRLHDNYDPMQGLTGDTHYYYIAILHAPEEGPDPLAGMKLVDGADLGLISGGSPDERAYRLSQATENCWYYNDNINVSFAKFFDKQAAATILVEYKKPIGAVVEVLGRRVA